MFILRNAFICELNLVLNMTSDN